jgi:hypothetical protein
MIEIETVAAITAAAGGAGMAATRAIGNRSIRSPGGKIAIMPDAPSSGFASRLFSRIRSGFAAAGPAGIERPLLCLVF